MTLQYQTKPVPEPELPELEPDTQPDTSESSVGPAPHNAHTAQLGQAMMKMEHDMQPAAKRARALAAQLSSPQKFGSQDQK